MIDKATAKAEVNAWLDSLDVHTERREDANVSSVINSIEDAICKCRLVINEDGTVTQNLIAPMGDGGQTKQVSYSDRYTVGDWHDKLKKIIPGDVMGGVIAKLSVISGQPELFFKKMTKRDYDIAQLMVVFF